MRWVRWGKGGFACGEDHLPDPPDPLSNYVMPNLLRAEDPINGPRRMQIRLSPIAPIAWGSGTRMG